MPDRRYPIMSAQRGAGLATPRPVCVSIYDSQPCANFDFCALRLQTFVSPFLCCCFLLFLFLFSLLFYVCFCRLVVAVAVTLSNALSIADSLTYICSQPARSTISFIYLSVHSCLCVCYVSPARRAFFTKRSSPQALGVRRSVSAVG